ncbi:MAG: hypothetical protein HXY41_05475, partial [Chloroflexi bacterium]|nr:hypothetical protein [Chloroflexota bacterium]
MGRLRFVCILVIFIFALAALPAVAQDSLSPGDSASGTATVSRPVSYLLNVNPGDIITVRAQTDGFLRQRVYGANDEQVRRPDFKSSRETSIYVFEMDEAGPYRLELSGDAAFSLTIESGDTLTLDRGVIKPGQSANATATLDRLDIYTLEVAAPLTLTLDLQNAPGAPVSGSARLTGITGSAQQAEVTTMARHLNVYTLESAGTFRLVVNVEQGDYTLSIVEGDTVTNNLGALQPGQTISGTIVPDRVDFYDIQASPEARITVTFQGITDSRNAPRVDLVGEGFDRNDIETEEEDKGITVYVLDEDPPYRLAVAGEGSYTLSWSGGDTLTSAGGALVAGQPVMAGLVAGQPAVFMLEGLAEGAAGSLLAGLDFTSVENPQPIITAMTLTNGSGEILPLTEIVSTGELPLFADYATWLFELAGPAPYTLTVEGERAAPLLLNPTLKPGETAQLMAEPYSETGLTLALDAAESLV